MQFRLPTHWKPRTRRFVRMIGIGFLALVVGVTIWLGRLAQIGAGYGAKTAGSAMFVAGRSRESIVAGRELDHIPFVKWKADHDNRSVTAWIGPVRRTAVVREGLGTVLLPRGCDTTGFRAPAFSASDVSTSEGGNDRRPWPMGDAVPADYPEGIDKARLDSIVSTAFEEPSNDPEQQRGTRAIIVVHNEQIIAERYAPGFDRQTPLIGWSMTKSLISALAGTLVGEGKLDIQSAPVLPEWSDPNDPRSKLTLGHLLRMSSGLEFGEHYDKPLSDVCRMLYTAHDAGSFAATKPLGAEPDTVWQYSSGTTNIIAKILRNTVADDAVYHAMPRKNLFDRIGMRSAVIETDASGTFVGSSFGWATARDWARFGLLFLNDGVWEGERILPEGWVAYCRTPTPTAPQGCYGAQWWCNAGASGDNEETRPRPRLPGDYFAARGFQGAEHQCFSIAELCSRKVGSFVSE